MSELPIHVAQVMGIMNRGGVEAVVMNYYRAIDRSRVQFDFFVDEHCSFPQRQEIEKLGGRCYLVASYAKPIRYLSELIRLFRQNKYSIVHSQINTMGVLPLFAAWVVGVQIRICHNHSTSHPGEGKKTLLKHLLRPLTKLFATNYFACGEAAARWMFGIRLVDRGEVTLLPNAVQLSQYRYSIEDRITVRKELKINDDAFVVGHIGRFTFQKNHIFLINVFCALISEIPDAVLMLAGEGELFEHTKEVVHNLNLDSQIRFLGARDDTNRLYSVMDVFCLPSFYEGLPVVMIEALANGLSCVVSENVTSELNQLQVKQLSLEGDIQSWVHALINSKRSDQMPSALVAKYDIESAAKRLQDFYTSKQE